MSGTLNNKDKEWLLNTRTESISALEESLISSIFDQQTDFDCKEIELKIKKNKELRKVSLYKIYLSPFEILLSFFMFGKSSSLVKIDLTKLYLKFYRNKISYELFQKELQYLGNKGKII